MPAASAQEPAPTKITVAIKAYENNLTPFTLTMLSLPDVHDTVNLIYDTLFWSQVKENPEPWLAERADPSPHLTRGDARPRALESRSQRRR